MSITAVWRGASTSATASGPLRWESGIEMLPNQPRLTERTRPEKSGRFQAAEDTHPPGYLTDMA
eukprot:328373-Amphidinium_carterae.1